MKSISIKDCISQTIKDNMNNNHIKTNEQLLPELTNLTSNEVSSLIYTTTNKDFINRLILNNNHRYLIELIHNKNLTKKTLIELYNLFESQNIKYLYQYNFLKNEKTPLFILKLIFNCELSMGLNTNRYLEYFVYHHKTTTSFLKQIFKKYPNQKEYFLSKGVSL